MKQRGIDEWEIEHIIKSPSYTKRRLDGKIEANAEVRQRFVKVVYIKLQNYIKIKLCYKHEN